MKHVFNLAGPFVLGCYAIAFMAENPSANNYISATVALVLAGCIVWFTFGITGIDG